MQEDGPFFPWKKGERGKTFGLGAKTAPRASARGGPLETWDGRERAQMPK